jgi:hypothetical protein
LSNLQREIRELNEELSKLKSEKESIQSNLMREKTMVVELQAEKKYLVRGIESVGQEIEAENVRYNLYRGHDYFGISLIYFFNFY